VTTAASSPARPSAFTAPRRTSEERCHCGLFRPAGTA
jgi:hypothetical protein